MAVSRGRLFCTGFAQLHLSAPIELTVTYNCIVCTQPVSYRTGCILYMFPHSYQFYWATSESDELIISLTYNLRIPRSRDARGLVLGHCDGGAHWPWSLRKQSSIRFKYTCYAPRVSIVIWRCPITRICSAPLSQSMGNVLIQKLQRIYDEPYSNGPPTVGSYNFFAISRPHKANVYLMYYV